MDIKVKTPVGDNNPKPESSTSDNDTTATTTKESEVAEKPQSGQTSEEQSTESPTGNTTDQSDEGKTAEAAQEEVITVDGEEYSLNEKGDAVDKDGNVFKTKDELDSLTEEPVDEEDTTQSPGGKEKDASISDIEKMSGIEVYKDGKKIEYDISVEGLAKRENDIKELGLKEGKDSAVNEFFSSNPDLYKAFLYKSKKGTLEGFTNEPFYQSIELDTSNEDQLFNFIVEAEVKKGSSSERAKDIAKFFKAEHKLEEEGKGAYNYLVDQEKQEIDSYNQQEQNQKKKAIKDEAEFFGTYFDENGKEVIVKNEGSVYDKVVEKGSFGNFVIPESGLKVKNKEGEIQTLNRKQVYDYVSKPVTKEGFTQAQVDEMNRMSSMDSMLYQYILNLTGNDVNQLIQRKILEEKGKTIKKKLVSKPKTSQPSSKPSSSDKKVKTPV